LFQAPWQAEVEDLLEQDWHQFLAGLVAGTPMLVTVTVLVKWHPAGTVTAADQMVHRLRA
jgi:hypothetical protein